MKEKVIMQPVIKVDKLSKSFGSKIKALDNINLTVQPGEMVALIGASGSGKSTLLRHLAGLVVADCIPNACDVRVLNKSVQSAGRLSSDIRKQRAQIGFVFQQFNLVGRLSVITNVLAGNLARLPLYRSIFRRFTRGEKYRAVEALDRVGIADWAHQRASTLSGGQQQRAAIARALVQKAKVILADEPIASLDPESSRRVMETLARINKEDGTTVLVSLHQVDYAMHFCPRVVALLQGKIVFNGPSEEVTRDLLAEVYSGDPDLDPVEMEKKLATEIAA